MTDAPAPDATTTAISQPDMRADSRRNRVRLVAAARELVAEKGLDVTAAEIAARAEVGVGTLYRRFGSKEALLDDILADGLDEVEAVALLSLEDPDAWNGLVAFFRFFSQTQVGNQGIAEFLAANSDLPGEAIRDDSRPLRELVQQIVRRAHDAGVLRADVTWQDFIVLSRASVDAGDCLGFHAPSDQWERTCAVILNGLRAPR
ncbi:AcrR family transcriptional regulator [Conyzicola lurida]|uniref:AcrR family transcriptional regulator n=1 Tax=Conyzicola lurida TaxID=1172621 RepID=A0A841AMF7_9MICO|nr:TetR/AcrR family transcriptional regulator [Conyzicola lurida]MBB5843508.1 AcrR family transcriptional regulator [Conyzicola lurida]